MSHKVTTLIYQAFSNDTHIFQLSTLIDNGAMKPRVHIIFFFTGRISVSSRFPSVLFYLMLKLLAIPHPNLIRTISAQPNVSIFPHPFPIPLLNYFSTGFVITALIKFKKIVFHLVTFISVFLS